MKLRKAKFGTSYELTDEQIKARHTAFDYNKNGEVSLDELLGSIALKNKWMANRLPASPSVELVALWAEEKALFDALDEELKKKYAELSVQEKAEEHQGYKWRMDLFDEADANKDGLLDIDEWKVYYKKIEERSHKMAGGGYTFTDEYLEKSWKLHDFDASGGVTKDELIWARKMKKA